MAMSLHHTLSRGPLRAGAATVSITPPLGVELAGSFTKRRATHIHDELYAHALVLDNGLVRLALVSLDLICIPGSLVAQARQLIETRTGIPGGHVMIGCTHTHSAPATTGLLGADPDPNYVAELPERIAAAVTYAAAQTRPARLGWATGHEPRLSFNRRYHMRDGTVRMNPGRGDPDIVRPAGPIDPDVGVLYVEALDGTPIAVVVSFALHYVGVDSATEVSADYFGHFGRRMQELHGAALHTIFFNGCSGDINAVDVANPHQLAGHREAARVAAILADDVTALLSGMSLVEEVILGAVQRRPVLPRRAQTPQDLALARRILANPPEHPRAGGIPAQGPFSWVVGQPIPDTQLRQYAIEVLHLATMPEHIQTEVQALRVGEAAIVALPGEIFVELGLAIKAQSPFQTTLLAELANDYIGYVPTARAFREGSYETWAARSALPAPGAGELLVEHATAALAALQE
jgi:neutral ceramidase